MDPQPRLHPQSPGAETARAGPASSVSSAGEPPAFAHASEAELGRILDFYGVAWEYEPRTFPLMWNLDGQVTESFTPDFYLPELDLFVELTTLRQKLVRKKNRKLRRLREVYPEVRIKLLYAKDFRALMLKFGRIGLADAFSGTVGQTTPPRAARVADSVDRWASGATGDAARGRAPRPSGGRRRSARPVPDAGALTTPAGSATAADRPAASAPGVGDAEAASRQGRRALRVDA
jgi:hypothetical protein